MKKLLLSLGTVATITAPIAAVVSCGNKKQATVAQAPVVKTTTAQAKDLSEEFGKAFLADENILVSAINQDSMDMFMNNVIATYTEVQKAAKVNPTFEENFTFDHTNAAHVKKAAENFAPIIKNLIVGLVKTNNQLLKTLLDSVTSGINTTLMTRFASQEHLSVGIGVLIKTVLDDALDKYGTLLKPNLIAGLIEGLIPFKDANNQEITAEFKGDTAPVVFRYKDSTTPSTLLSSMSLSKKRSASVASTSATNTPAAGTQTVTAAPKTKLGLSSLMKVIQKTAVTNIVSGLIEYICTKPALFNALTGLIDHYANAVLHVPETNPFNAETKPAISFEPGYGFIDWNMTQNADGSLSFKDKDNNLLAVATLAGAQYNISFKVDQLPLREGLEGNTILGKINGELKFISVKELAAEQYVTDVFTLARQVIGMFLLKKTHYVEAAERANALNIDFTQRLEMARVIEAGLGAEVHENEKASTWLAKAIEIQKHVKVALEAQHMDASIYMAYAQAQQNVAEKQAESDAKHAVLAQYETLSHNGKTFKQLSAECIKADGTADYAAQDAILNTMPQEDINSQVSSDAPIAEQSLRHNFREYMRALTDAYDGVKKYDRALADAKHSAELVAQGHEAAFTALSPILDEFNQLMAMFQDKRDITGMGTTLTGASWVPVNFLTLYGKLFGQ